MVENSDGGTHQYTHGYGESVMQGHRRRTAGNSAAYLLPRLEEGMRLLDVGSGAGTITADLARILGPRQVTAVEIIEDAAAITRAELERAGLGDVDVVIADAHRLPFPDDSFDVAHAHQVLQHVASPVDLLAELRRVVRPGGLVAARDAEYRVFSWYPDEPGIQRWQELYLRAAIANGGTPDAGRHLLAWARAAGFSQIEAGASTWCYATPEERAVWSESWAGRISTGPLAGQIAEAGWAEPAELEDVAEAWRRWGRHPDGWFLVPHGEIIATV